MRLLPRTIQVSRLKWLKPVARLIRRKGSVIVAEFDRPICCATVHDRAVVDPLLLMPGLSGNGLAREGLCSHMVMELAFGGETTEDQRGLHGQADKTQRGYPTLERPATYITIEAGL